jgi:hypothetical protein
MKQVDTAVRRETLYIAAWVAVMSVLMQAVFLVIGRWDYTVLLGNLLGGAAAVGNFFLMGLTVQSAVNKEEKEAASMMKLSQKLRLLMLLVAAVLGVALPWFYLWATLIPLFFPRIAVAFRPVFNRR